MGREELSVVSCQLSADGAKIGIKKRAVKDRADESENHGNARADVGMGDPVGADRGISGGISGRIRVLDDRIVGLEGADEPDLSVDLLDHVSHADTLRDYMVGTELEDCLLRARAIEERALARKGGFTCEGHRSQVAEEHGAGSSADGGEHQMWRQGGARHGIDPAYAGA